MTRHEATQLAKQIVHESNYTVRVIGYRHDGWMYGIDCKDVATGYPFVVWTEEDWQERNLNR